ncbi:hypothetical protein Tco_0226070 [Tanacetum coccineum]
MSCCLEGDGGQFSCRSAYLLALKADEDMVRTTISDDSIDFWRVVWKARVPICGEHGIIMCSWCGGPFNGGNCRRCTNVSFGDEFVRNPDPISYDETPDFSYPPPQPQTYSCELCGNDSHYGYDCPPRVPLVYEQEPCYNQNFGDNYYPQNSPSFPQQYLCCENCGGPHANFQCQPRNQNFYEPNLCYNSNSSGFDQPPQYSIDHQPQSIQEDLNQQKMNDVHNE